MDKMAEKIKKIVLRRFDPSRFDVYLFGSRAQGRAKKFSDWDIGLVGHQGRRPGSIQKARLQADLEKEKIPYLLEVVDLNKVSPEFRSVALKNAILWKS